MKRNKIALLSFFLMGALAVSAYAQQQVRGRPPEGVFVVDPNKVASWSNKIFSEGEKKIPIKEFNSERLERWNHEFPVHYAGLNDKIIHPKIVELNEWEGAKTQKWNVKKNYETRALKVENKSPLLDNLILNEKWSRGGAAESLAAKQFTPDKQAAAADFIAQVGIRPLEEPELQEKLNEYSRPPGRRTGSPSLPQKSSKF